MIRIQLKRLGAVSLAAGLLAVAVGAPALAGDSRTVSIGTSPYGDGQLPNNWPSVSFGEQLPAFSVYVKNNGPQALNNVQFQFGQDGLPSVDEREGTFVPSADYPAPVAPVDLPDHVFVSVTPSRTVDCSASTTKLITCNVGQLTARGSGSSINFLIQLSTDQSTSAATVPTKARVTVAEVGNDNGANTDTFAAEGGVSLLGYSCDNVAAYRPGNSNKTVSTCTGTDNPNGQYSSITIPSRLSTVVLSEAPATEPCDAPSTGVCYGYTTFVNIPDDTQTDVLIWTMTIDVGDAKVNLQKLYVNHFTDEALIANSDGDPNNDIAPIVISLAKSNACSTKNPVNCGSASLSNGLLTVIFKTAGNGSGKTYG